jgi:hypothetical protein
VIGGVISSTLLTLLVLPVLYTVFSLRRGAAPKTSAEQPSPEGQVAPVESMDPAG